MTSYSDQEIGRLLTVAVTVVSAINVPVAASIAQDPDTFVKPAEGDTGLV